jgi:hypothetical protein
VKETAASGALPCGTSTVAGNTGGEAGLSPKPVICTVQTTSPAEFRTWTTSPGDAPGSGRPSEGHPCSSDRSTAPWVSASDWSVWSRRKRRSDV